LPVGVQLMWVRCGGNSDRVDRIQEVRLKHGPARRLLVGGPDWIITNLRRFTWQEDRVLGRGGARFGGRMHSPVIV